MESMSDAFTPFDPSWDAPQLPDSEASLPGSFEWWYFDMQTEDGVSLVVCFSRRNPVFVDRRPSVYVEFDGGGERLQRVRNYAPGSFSVHETAEGRELRIDRHSVRLEGDDPSSWVYHLNLRWPELGLELEFRPVHRGFVPGDQGTYFRHAADPGLYTAVSFSAPLMRVKGTIVADGRTREVHGRGYHDHPWGTRQLFFTHARWNWARLSSDTLGAMVADVTPNHAYEGRLRFFYEGDFGTFEPKISPQLEVAESEWAKDGLFGLRCPRRVEFRSEGRAWILDCEHALLDTPIYNRSEVTWSAASGTTGKGWVEYFNLPAAFPTIAFWGARLLAFFWRPFPWFGR
jgi:hypothetical protein